MNKKILVISDNIFLIKQWKRIISELELKECSFDYKFSFKNENISEVEIKALNLSPVDIKREEAQLIEKYDLIFSLHCKQIFPPKLVSVVKCINIHPGFNPFNRGWVPHVFSIINGLKAGATIHEIAEKIDGGPIIAQKELKIFNWDTSLSVYKRILQLELDLIKDNLDNIINGNYKTFVPQDSGNYNSINDFKELCKLDINKNDSIKNTLNLLRALTHGEYKNAYFLDENGKKVYVKLSLEKVDD